MERLNDKVPTFDLLWIMQTFSEISENFGEIFVKLEFLFLKWYEQLTIEQMSCAACGFAVAGFGSDYFYKLLEVDIWRNFELLDIDGEKEICWGFIYSNKGSKQLFNLMIPKIMGRLEKYSFIEKCFIVDAYHKQNLLSKRMALDLELSIA